MAHHAQGRIRFHTKTVPIFRRCTLIFYLFFLCVEMCRFGVATPILPLAPLKSPPTRKSHEFTQNIVIFKGKNIRKWFE